MKPECPLCCMVPCDREIDRAVTRIHRWFRGHVLASIQRPKIGKNRPPGGSPTSERKRSVPVVIPRDGARLRERKG